MREFLLYLGEIEHPESQEARFQFLVQCLNESQPTIRLGAASGLESLEDSRAVEELKKASARERSPLVAEVMRSVTAGIEAVSRRHAASRN